MKKLLSLIMILMLVFGVSGCGMEFNGYSKEIVAPVITESEQSFMDLYQELKPASVGILASINYQGNTQSNLGTGLIFHKEANNYYVVTTLSNVYGNSVVDIYISETKRISGTVIYTQASSLDDLNEEDDLAVVRFQASENLKVIELDRIDDPQSVLYYSVFSIGPIIAPSFFNYPTSPFFISSGMFDNIIVHGADLNYGQVGSPLYLSNSGLLIGINVFISTRRNDRQEERINHAIFINRVIDVLDLAMEGIW